MTETIQDPSKRYTRREEISRTDRCIEYRAADQNEGTEVLWHEFKLDPLDSANKNLIEHIKTLGRTKHPNLINLYHAWLDKKKHIIYFLTEYFANQTLSSYVQNVGHNLTRTAIGNWCVQIMDALEFLHSMMPPFIHSDVSCQNIFIDPSEGIVKLGLPDLDMYLSNEIKPMQAPEAQEYVSDPKSDVWTLGMAVLEMITSKKPFSEAKTDIQLREAICSRSMPSEFLEIDDPIIADFIQVCFLPLEQRPSISQLRDHPLFAEIELNQDTGSQSTTDVQYREISSDIKNMPEFTALLQRQKAEKQEILKKHDLQKMETRERIRQRLQNLGRL
ncbi:STE family protein kinase [Tritrichomonas foetus]|uniref:STE family protein kinase n=1 Tax=Tritrichomonas foetus TaxID=1144522 RepID=A0A1J4KSB1_9EUKA|nr:STE family protein kinase [Tritrichomonas foetus]|eukprot:OHT12357.1 STE family protein kinase [Tritrichomonas foetus]